MSEPFIAEIKIFGGNFAPRGYAFCSGQLLPIAQNTALFSLVGTTYGGDGRTTLGLPNLQARAPMHPGRGPGLSNSRIGEVGGGETVTLTEAQMPNHTHTMQGTNRPADRRDPANRMPAAGCTYYTAAADTSMAAACLPAAGGSQAHNNMMPYLAMYFIIALEGLYPSRD